MGPHKNPTHHSKTGGNQIATRKAVRATAKTHGQGKGSNSMSARSGGAAKRTDSEQPSQGNVGGKRDRPKQIDANHLAA
jgi:hypothetical protein